jgi:shikimate 5-dehydrogenase
MEMIKQTHPTMYFIGVTTGESSSRRMFPVWAQILGLDDAQLVGVDLPINASPEAYRQAVYQIKQDPLILGALVTTHKINVLKAARDLFDQISEDAGLTNEVSCIYKRQGHMIAHAFDPETNGQAMGQFLGDDYWLRTSADMLCLGAGGSATALVAHFLTRKEPGNRPRRFFLVDRQRSRLDELQALVGRLPHEGTQFDFLCHDDPHYNDSLMERLSPGSLVVNATGMGKDLPGSPVTDDGVFPEKGIAWELNYRGELGFLRQAQAQTADRQLKVVDGWYYFLVGWAALVSRVFEVEIDPGTFQRLCAAADSLRSG